MRYFAFAQYDNGFWIATILQLLTKSQKSRNDGLFDFTHPLAPSC
ncbi:hypothetical protein [Helicobacter sp. T3_23-1059]